VDQLEDLLRILGDHTINLFIQNEQKQV